MTDSRRQRIAVRIFAALLALAVIAVLVVQCSTGGLPGIGGPQSAGGTSQPTTETPPTAPSDLTGDVAAVFDVPVGWKDNSDNETGFNVYRQRIDVLGKQEKAGAASADETGFLDGGTYCGATYQYVVASFNSAGESPASACWQITLPACPFPSKVKLTAGNAQQVADFYLTAGGSTLMADLPGQNGLVDLGDVGEQPLHSIAMPAPADYKKDGLPAVQGHTYAALMTDGQSVMVFTLKTLDDQGAETVGIIWRPGKTITGACQPLANVVPGGACVNGDGICDPTCTGGGDSDCGDDRCISGDGVCVAECGGTVTGDDTLVLVSVDGAPVDQGCETCTTTYYQTDSDCVQGTSWSDTACTPTTNQVCQPPCPADDPNCDDGGTETPPPCDPQTGQDCGTPPVTETPPPCIPGVAAASNQDCPTPTVTETPPPCVPGAATSPNDPCGTPPPSDTPPPCVPGAAASNQDCTTPTVAVTEPPRMCEAGWVPVGECVCCGPHRVCPDHVEENHEICAPPPDDDVCTCIPVVGAAANIGYCAENPNKRCTP